MGANDALYALDGNSASSGTANSTRNLNAPSGFGTTSYTGERAAASFAILDAVFRAKELVLTAAPNTAFPELQLFWSDTRIADRRPLSVPTTATSARPATSCSAQGEIDNCGQTNADGIYILGDFTQPATPTSSTNP